MVGSVAISCQKEKFTEQEVTVEVVDTVKTLNCCGENGTIPIKPPVNEGD